MGRLVIFVFLVLMGAGAVVFFNHYDLVQKPRDQDNIRQQFHLPDSIAFATFDSSPKAFLPEGLRIVAEVQFTETQFNDYLARLDDPQIWKPVPIIGYSPAIGDVTTAAAHTWRDMPFPPSLASNPKKLIRLDRDPLPRTGAGARYFCSTLSIVPTGRRLPDNPNALERKTHGTACDELPVEWPTVVMFGLLGPSTRRLHAAIYFSA
ncbi:MAG: hypothetical protein ACK5JT_01520 [Hyphomicrobiaceae bacterium]